MDLKCIVRNSNNEDTLFKNYGGMFKHIVLDKSGEVRSWLQLIRIANREVSLKMMNIVLTAGLSLFLRFDSVVLGKL